MDVLARVEDMGDAARQGDIPRHENPYLELVTLKPANAADSAAAQALVDAWWRGWDRADHGK